MMNQMVVSRSAAGSICRVALALRISTVLFGVLATCAPAHAQGFVGIWNNRNPNTTEIVRLQISPDPNPTGLAIRAFAAGCQPPCDLGPVPLSPDGNKASAFYDFGFSFTTFQLELLDSFTLRVRTFTTFTDGSGRQPREVIELFSRG